MRACERRGRCSLGKWMASLIAAAVCPPLPSTSEELTLQIPSLFPTHRNIPAFFLLFFSPRRESTVSTRSVVFTHPYQLLLFFSCEGLLGWMASLEHIMNNCKPLYIGIPQRTCICSRRSRQNTKAKNKNLCRTKEKTPPKVTEQIDVKLTIILFALLDYN